MSSTSWAEMPLFERDTTRRGRSDVPRTLPRTRRWRRCLASLTVRVLMLAFRRRSRPSATADRWRGFGGTGRFLRTKSRCPGRRSCSLPNLPADVLPLIADPLVLVPLPRSHLASLRSAMPLLLLLHALDVNFPEPGDIESDATR